MVDGYCSDLTRTVVLGSATDTQRGMYGAVLGAQGAGIATVGPGVSGADAYEAACKVLETAGMAETFTHGLGHGVGLDIHEAPTLKTAYPDVLQTSDVVTVEPGVYIAGEGGVRIEDCVLVTDDGSEVLGSSPKDRLLEL
jgi:Xaa-Pro aminopeptidase